MFSKKTCYNNNNNNELLCLMHTTNITCTKINTSDVIKSATCFSTSYCHHKPYTSTRIKVPVTTQVCVFTCNSIDRNAVKHSQADIETDRLNCTYMSLIGRLLARQWEVLCTFTATHVPSVRSGHVTRN